MILPLSITHEDKIKDANQAKSYLLTDKQNITTVLIPGVDDQLTNWIQSNSLEKMPSAVGIHKSEISRDKSP
jgi:hypothetical protein